MDRRKLADALRDATPAMLREDAEAMLRVVDLARRSGFSRVGDGPNLRLAALALAVAYLQEETDVSIEKAGKAVYLALSSRPELPRTDTLPAALAALIEEGA